MYYPSYRMSRLRRTPAIRDMVRETTLELDDLIYPLLRDRRARTSATRSRSMPGLLPALHRQPARPRCARCVELGIPAVLLFGIPAHKDSAGTGAYDPEGIVQLAVRAIKDEFPDLVVITDVCLCEYTDHGHCGVDRRTARSSTTSRWSCSPRWPSRTPRAGADIVAPERHDGRPRRRHPRRARRRGLRRHDPSWPTRPSSPRPSTARSARPPSRAPAFGDRKTYQMDPANGEEAVREVALDIEEGADIVMVKPALAYLDVIRAVKQETSFPLAAYNVSGEYAMIKAAAANGWLDEERAVMEALTGIKRAGADLIITYHAKDVAALDGA